MNFGRRRFRAPGRLAHFPDATATGGIPKGSFRASATHTHRRLVRVMEAKQGLNSALPFGVMSFACFADKASAAFGSGITSVFRWPMSVSQSTERTAIQKHEDICALSSSGAIKAQHEAQKQPRSQFDQQLHCQFPQSFPIHGMKFGSGHQWQRTGCQQRRATCFRARRAFRRPCAPEPSDGL